MVKEDDASNLRFDGSVWCNLQIAFRQVDKLFTDELQDTGLAVVELYILRALYEEDGRTASQLAIAVGRAPTSFTPNIDKLEEKKLIERRLDPKDRRAIRLHLTQEAEARRDEVIGLAHRVDKKVAKNFTPEDFRSFLRVLATFQTLDSL